MHESKKWKWSHSVVSHSSRPHGLQPTRLLHPWDFPGKSTGVGCHCLLQGSVLMASFSLNYLFKNPISQYKSHCDYWVLGLQYMNLSEWVRSESRSVMPDSLQHHGLYSPWNSPGQNTGMASLSLPQGIFPTQESKLGLLHYRWILYQLSKNLEGHKLIQSNNKNVIPVENKSL